MALGFSVGVPGMRVRVSTRGVRASAGPRIARVSVGTGRTRVSSGFGPLSVSAPLGPRRSGGRATVRRTSRAYGPSPAQMAAAQRAAERAQREADRDAAIRRLKRMRAETTTAHLEQFRVSSRPQIAAPPPVPSAVALAQAEAHYLAGVGRLARAARAQAREQARRAAHAYAQAEDARLAAVHQSLQEEAEQLWDALCRNDEAAVCAVVDAAFADNPSAGCAVGVTGSTLSIVIRLPDLDSLPTQTPAVTNAGRPTLKVMPKRDRMRWWLHMLASNLAAAVLEALAAAPSITAVSAAVITRMPDTQRLGVIAYGAWSRSAMEASRWRSADDAWRIFDIGTDVQCSVKATAAGNISSVVRPLPLDRVPALAALLADCVDEPDAALGRVDADLGDRNDDGGPAGDLGGDPLAPMTFAEWLGARSQPSTAGARPAPSPRRPFPTERPALAGRTLQRGETFELPERAQAELHLEFRFAGADADLSVLLVDDHDHVGSDADFVFYNNPVAPDGTAKLLGKTSTSDGAAESAVLHPRAFRPTVRKAVVCANLDVAAGLTFAALRQATLVLCGDDQTWTFTPDVEPSVQAIVLVEIYLRAMADGTSQWKARAVGQGWDGGLAALARAYRVEIDD